MKIKTTILTTLFAVLLVSAILYANMPAKESNISVSIENPPFLSLEEIAENSPIIVYGKYLELISTYTATENQKNSSPDNLYSFQVDKIIKGNNVSENITVGKVAVFDISESVENIVGKNTPYEPYYLPYTYFIEPEYNKDYIVFLKYIGGRNIYTCSGEPWEIAFDENGIATLKSNAFNPDKNFINQVSTRIKPKNSSLIHKINISTNITHYDDFISGKTYRDIVKIIENTLTDK